MQITETTEMLSNYTPSGKGLILNITLGGSSDGKVKAMNRSLKEDAYY